MSDFLLELRSEEIPARMQAGARADLEKLFRAGMRAAGVAVGEVTVWSTPRRLALIARGLPERTAALREETRGPRTSAPPQALEGFLRKTGLTQDQLEDRDGVWFAVVERPGRAVKAVLAEAIPAIVRAFPWPRSMRWGAASLSTESLRWVRPLSGIVAIFGEALVECAVGELRSGYATRGHRFHCPGEITIGSAADYQEKLRACHVIVDHRERENAIRTGALAVAADAGLALVLDEGLVIENAGLTEWPVPLLGRFDAAFLDVPPEVTQLTARVNQKYFVCTKSSPGRGGGSRAAADGGGAPHKATSREADNPLHRPADGSPPRPGEDLAPKLANAFVCTANIEAADGGAAIVDGNRKVLAARLADARFFWEQDRKVPLEDQAKKLERITFHEKLGTVADKVERVARLARWLVEEGIVGSNPSPATTVTPLPGGEGMGVGGPTSRASSTPTQPSPSRGRASLADLAQLANLAEQAARLAKADLVTEMVGEFPELQGVMGGYYARSQGLPDEVADAIRDHYKPVGQGDEVPTAPVTVAVSLADKLDTIAGFFLIGERPTGSKDPFALRRAALGILEIVFKCQLRMETMHFFALAAGGYGRQFEKRPEYQGDYEDGLGKLFTAEFYGSVTDFIFDRLKVQQRANGVRHDLLDAVFAVGDDQPIRMLARVNALQTFIATEDGANLLAAYKRAANILRKEDWHGCEGEIARTGEEDPLALVDDPDLKAVIETKMADCEQKVLSYSREPAEKALIEALDSAEPQARVAVEAEDFEAAMAALATLRAPIDRFFDTVTVNDTDPAKRCARLDLLARFRDAVHQVADFSKIEG